ncbi:uncharacterized protein LOC106061063 [Biomphalaria glabrata]|uniref:Uncharacterized protein LOC106061063 n=1 Tax=Biomphalaria glabrata TaxID=6526 RepID=A0A9W2YIE8_BIOGL|nr:uncharacterized protein LOC106061063 [Biomphalaria glabrata]
MKRFGILVILVLLFCAEFQMIPAFPGGTKDVSGEANKESKEVSLEDSHEESAQKDTSRNKRSFEETSSEKSSEEYAETSPEIPFETFFRGTIGCGEKPDLYTGPCAYCECIGFDWECFVADCGEVQCVDGYRPEGECCVECPNGPNCLYNDRIISVGESFFNDDGESCTCQETDIWTEAPEIQCA